MQKDFAGLSARRSAPRDGVLFTKSWRGRLCPRVRTLLSQAMKFPLVFLLLYSGLAFADVRVQEGKITADFYSEPLSTVIQKMEQETNIHFTLDESVAGQTVSASFEGLPLGLAIKKMLEGTGINYAVLARENGEPQAVFIGTSERPGASARRLDNRPVGARGVVTPIVPQVPVPQEKPMPPGRRGLNTPVNVPTGGGYVPQVQEPPKPEDQEPENQENEQPEEQEE